MALEVPGPRVGHSLVYSDTERAIFLVDGYLWNSAIAPTPPNRTELWRWNGASWRREASLGPRSRTMSRAVYDSRRRQIVSYGGRVGADEVTSHETWQWRQGQWRSRGTRNTGPSVHVEMAYDSARATVVRFGGATRGAPTWSQDTYAWDGTRWNVVARDGPPARAAAGMVYDPERSELVLFGGQGPPDASGTQIRLGDTWTWNGIRWRSANLEGLAPRAYHSMAFDPVSREVVLHGGSDGGLVFDDLWSWNGVRWKRLDAQGGPGPRRLHAMVGDPSRRIVLLYGGAGPRRDGQVTAFDDTWVWNGVTWRAAGPSNFSR